MRVVWQPRASRHVEKIRSYIQRYNPGAAGALAEQIAKSAHTISTHPQIGKTGRHPHTREFAVAGTPYIIVYRVRDVAVEVLAVLHGAQVVE